MSKGTMKPDVMLRLEGWVKEEEAPTLTLVGPKELPIGTGIPGSLEMSPTRLFQIMREQKEGGKLPVFRMMVIDPDAEVKREELKKQQEEDKKSPKLDLDNGQKAAAARKKIEDEEKAKKAKAGTPPS